MENFIYSFVTKGFKSVVETIDDKDRADIEGIIFHIDPILATEKQSYINYIQKVQAFEKEYEITWNRAIILKGLGEIYSTVDNISSLKSLKDGPNVIFLTVDQVKVQTTHMKSIINPTMKSLHEYLNYCISEFGWLYIIDTDNFKVVEVAKPKKILNKKLVPTKKIGKSKKIHSITKKSRTVSNAKKSTSRKKHKFLRSIGK